MSEKSPILCGFQGSDMRQWTEHNEAPTAFLRGPQPGLLATISTMTKGA